MLNKTIFAAVAAFGLSLIALSAVSAQEDTLESGYVSANDLNMYYEIYGEGEPLVVLHGAYMSTMSTGETITRFADTHQVIAFDLQGHGRTADVDRPITYEGMADDVAAAMEGLSIEKANVFGYSMGAGVALQLAIRHPEKVNKLIAVSVTYSDAGMHPGLMEMFDTITPEVFVGSPMEAEYRELAPNPEKFPVLVEKLKVLDTTAFDWGAENIQGITAPTLLMAGDSDIVTPEHAVEMFRLLGGGVFGDLAGLPNSQLAILPGTHHMGMMTQLDLIVPMVNAFLAAPVTEVVPAATAEAQ